MSAAPVFASPLLIHAPRPSALYLPYCPKGAMTFALDHLGSLTCHQQTRYPFCPEPDPASQRCSHWPSQPIKSVVVTLSIPSLVVLFPSPNQRQG
jgi:hypothetical protein